VQALWPGYDGGASRETVIKTGALGYHPKRGERRAAIVTVFSYSNDSFQGTYLGGLAGDGSTLVLDTRTKSVQGSRADCSKSPAAESRA